MEWILVNNLVRQYPLHSAAADLMKKKVNPYTLASFDIFLNIDRSWSFQRKFSCMLKNYYKVLKTTRREHCYLLSRTFIIVIIAVIFWEFFTSTLADGFPL